MNITFIENEPKYKVGDVVVTRNYETFKVAEVIRKDLPESWKKHYASPSLYGALTMFVPIKDEDKEYGLYIYHYEGLEKPTIESMILGSGEETLCAAIFELLEERNSLREDMQRIQSITTNWHPTDC